MIVNKYDENPILEPNTENFWEAEAVFNGCPIEKDGKIYLFYRALSQMHYHAPGETRLMVSSIGIAESFDGKNFYKRKRLVVPENEIDKFGAEDPRVVRVDDTYYVFFTVLSKYPFEADGIKVAAITSKDLNSFSEKRLVTPFNSKAMSLFPERINGKLTGILTVNTDLPPESICIVTFDKDEDLYNADFWNNWYSNLNEHILNLPREENDFVELGATPIKTDHGWLVIYAQIKNYFSDKPIFTVQAALLDLENPKNVLGTTRLPIIGADEYYEEIGFVPNVVFPSGALLNKNKLSIYYGGADTFCCLAEVEFDTLVNHIFDKEEKNVRFNRLSEFPIISPIQNNSWESKATFNPASIYLDGKFHIVYRAMSEDNTSVMGYANSADGVKIDYRASDPIYVPRDQFEEKRNLGGNSGCEDPRLVQVDDRVYMFYTAYNGIEPPRVAVSSITVNDFISNNWNWEMPKLISPPGVDDKDAFVFPEKIGDKFYIVHRNGIDIDLSFSYDLDFSSKTWLEEYRWIYPRKGWWDSQKVGAAAPPLKTDKGWIMLYHGVSEDNIYRVGAVLLDLEDPIKVLGRTENFLFEPEKDYELFGQVNNVVFPCGNVIFGDSLYIHYGGADSVVNVASIKVEELLKSLS
ncbi:hypothetical protein ACFL0C_01870 [Patescibacteria group bacterium]